MKAGRRSRQCRLGTSLVGIVWALLIPLVGFGRDPLRQPFHRESIWNMPIGSEAKYVHAKIQKATQRGMTVDEDLIVLTPGAPMLDIYRNDAGWNRNRSRCTIDGGILFRAPIPADFIVSPDTWDGVTPNSGLAVLMPDGRTIRQTQPFARCTPDYGTSRYIFGDEDLYGQGYYGAHGGSGLSCLGGALRVGELVPGAAPIRHALKVNLYAARNLYYDQETRGCRWPAKRADGYAARTYGTKGEPVKECRMGALLALPPSISIDGMGLETDPARMLARALQDYGAYIVDDTAWDVYALVTEWGPAGRVKEEFQRLWGFEIDPGGRDNPWARDMDRIFTNLHVVVNNGPDRIGGGGQPRVPLAEPLDETFSGRQAKGESAGALTDAPIRQIDMTPHLDDQTALANPHKGWYHHYPDNHVNKYLIGKDADLLEFPGMDHLYLRLAWAYLEPQEGRFDWDVIDRIIGKWVGHGLGQPDSSMAKYGRGKTGPDFLREALGILHATYIGYHGLADIWLKENPDLTKELLNRCGYWYFLHRVAIPDHLVAGQMCNLQLVWENRGVAPAYHAYQLKVRLAGQEVQDFTLPAGNQTWMPSGAKHAFTEGYRLQLPPSMAAGTYSLGLKLYCPEEDRDVRLALAPSLLDGHGYYRVCSTQVVQPP